MAFLVPALDYFAPFDSNSPLTNPDFLDVKVDLTPHPALKGLTGLQQVGFIDPVSGNETGPRTQIAFSNGVGTIRFPSSPHL